MIEEDEHDGDDDDDIEGDDDDDDDVDDDMMTTFVCRLIQRQLCRFEKIFEVARKLNEQTRIV